jgi:hypothetical protein
MWNYLMRLEAESIEYRFKNIVGNADGSKTLATRNEIAFQYPQYYKDATPESWSGEYAILRFNTLEPLQGRRIAGHPRQHRHEAIAPGLAIPGRPAPRAPRADGVLRHA